MKIIHVVGSLNTGGVQKFILQLSQSPSLKKYKHQVLCTIQSIDNYNYNDTDTYNQPKSKAQSTSRKTGAYYAERGQSLKLIDAINNEVLIDANTRSGSLSSQYILTSIYYHFHDKYKK